MNRIVSFDLARGFTVLFIPAIHTVLLYGDASVHESWLGYFFTAIAEGPGAQLFIFLMGFYIGVRPSRPARAVLKRGLLLFLAGALLNYLKYGLWFELGLLPEAVMHELWIVQESPVARIVWMGDTLHFAGIAYVLIGLLRRNKYCLFVFSGLAFILAFVSSYTWNFLTGIGSLDFLLNYFTGYPPQVYFPAFPWLCFGCAGAALALLFRTSQRDFYRVLLGFGVFLVVMGGAVVYSAEEWSFYGFYRPKYGATLVHIGVVLLTLYLWRWLEKTIRYNGFFRLLSYSSRHITRLYFIQWILVCAFLPLVPFQGLSLPEILPLLLLTTSLTYAVNEFIQRKISSHALQGHARL